MACTHTPTAQSQGRLLNRRVMAVASCCCCCSRPAGWPYGDKVTWLAVWQGGLPLRRREAAGARCGMTLRAPKPNAPAREGGRGGPEG